MTELTYRRVSDAPPPVRDQVALDAGELTVWRSNGAEVGRFAGRDDDASRLRALLPAAIGARRPAGTGRVPADAVVEVLTAGDVELAIGPGDRPDGAWGELLAACRDVLDNPGPPVAAIGLVIEGPGRLRLEHRGSESLRVGLGAVIAETVVFRDGAQAGLAQSRSPTVPSTPDRGGRTRSRSSRSTRPARASWRPSRCPRTTTASGCPCGAR